MIKQTFEKTAQILEYNKILNQLEEYACTNKAKEKIRCLQPYLSEQELISQLRETSEARIMLDQLGLPPLVSLKDLEIMLGTIEKEGILMADQLEFIATFLVAVNRIKSYLEKGKYLEIGLPYYCENLYPLEEIREEIHVAIRNGRVDDYASKQLREIRKNQEALQERIRSKIESILKSHKEYVSDQFVTMRNGHYCIPVKAEYKFKINGSVIDKSASGFTLFIEPTVITKFKEELSLLAIAEENEERKILYILTGLVEEVKEQLKENMNTIEKLDFIFSKGKLSVNMSGIQPNIRTDRTIRIKKGRHPLLAKEQCVPLDFEMDVERKGIIITGPNTGGKTVAIKTVGLLSLMAQSGLHVPCEEADLTMNSQILCDIGDGQSITENLSTFSAHITNIISILEHVNQDSLVILDELGSGTDPAEGMGIAVAILEELRSYGCLTIATTHYPEIKQYAKEAKGYVNARMVFDKETLKPTYQLVIGEAGESCALYIARKLGMKESMIARAYEEAYQKKPNHELIAREEMEKINPKHKKIKEANNKYSGPRIEKKKEKKVTSDRASTFKRGDSVIVYPDRKIGIVYQEANQFGEVGIQLKKEKYVINHRRIKLYIKASQLYPPDYDFSVVFDSVEMRKKRHDMERKYKQNMELAYEESTKKR